MEYCDKEKPQYRQVRFILNCTHGKNEGRISPLNSSVPSVGKTEAVCILHLAAFLNFVCENHPCCCLWHSLFISSPNDIPLYDHTTVYPFCSSGLGLCCHQHLCAGRLVNIRVYFGWAFSYLGVEWLGHRTCIHSALVDNCQIAYRMVVAIDTPTSRE